MPPPKHVLERRGLTAEDWAKGYRTKEQKDNGGNAPVNPIPTPGVEPETPKPEGRKLQGR